MAFKNKVMVALDGFSNSKRGLKKAIDIAKETKSHSLAIHISVVPPPIHKINKKIKFPKKVTEILKHAETQCVKMVFSLREE